MVYNTVPFWIQIYDLPMIGRKIATMKQLGEKMGKFIAVDEETISGLSRIVRIRVEIDLLKPLKNGLKLKVDSRELWLPVKYERLPSFYYNCGKLGHVCKDCDVEKLELNQAPKAEEMKYGEWIRASPMKHSRKIVDKGRSATIQRNLVKECLSKQIKDGMDREINNSSRAPNEEVSELMSSLERVDMNTKTRTQLTNNLPKTPSSTQFPTVSFTITSVIPTPSNLITHTNSHLPKPTITDKPQNNLLPQSITQSYTTTLITQAQISQNQHHENLVVTNLHETLNQMHIPLESISTRSIRILRGRLNSGRMQPDDILKSTRDKRSIVELGYDDEEENIQKKGKLAEKEGLTITGPAAGVAMQPHRYQ